MRKIWITGVLAAALANLPTAFAAQIFDTGIIQLAVDEAGRLTGALGSVPSPVEAQTLIGLRYLPTGNEAITHGCNCEGWGAGNAATGTFGIAGGNEFPNFTSSTFDSDLQTAVVSNVVADELRVTHSFAPSVNANLYEISVSLTNIGTADMTDVRYTRSIDWDIEPSARDEVVTFGGMSTAASLLRISTDTAASPDPAATRNQILSGNSLVGPGDIGTAFDFAFGTLHPGESLTFKMFYGAAENQTLALTALGTVAAELYAIVSAACDADVGGTGCATPSNAFMVGFSGIGGTPLTTELTTGDVPLPAGAILLLSGLVGLGGASRKRAVAKQL
jgi:hypothetical protein